jgi:hypothetical protein
LDEAVAEAYGWGDDERAGKLTEDEILARLFALNQKRAKAQKTPNKSLTEVFIRSIYVLVRFRKGS